MRCFLRNFKRNFTLSRTFFFTQVRTLSEVSRLMVGIATSHRLCDIQQQAGGGFERSSGETHGGCLCCTGSRVQAISVHLCHSWFLLLWDSSYTEGALTGDQDTTKRKSCSKNECTYGLVWRTSRCLANSVSKGLQSEIQPPDKPALGMCRCLKSWTLLSKNLITYHKTSSETGIKWIN